MTKPISQRSGLLSAACLALALVACGQDDKARQQGGKAEGQILPASVSDAMVPLDQVRSQAPLAPRSEASGKAEDKDKSGKDDEAAAPAADASPAPAPAAAEEPAATEE